ncbi:iron ABC transporter permease [Nocardioides panacisoli]|uniref:ABC transporter permease n=1 Tax=Nocardioides panacisoli TaxID=627624 RepID=UPI001C632613|nr:iron ABC transporter permease [Nocardioides panacisoli]QYJ04936.1 iron ABC transporter permease [Nocardioides panacisoli]
MIRTGRGRWSLLVLVIAAVVASPVAAVAVRAATAGTPDLPRGVGTMTLGTVVLLVGTAAGCAVLGVGLAWLVSAHDFPFRRTLGWMLVLPLAVPAYILGFVYRASLDFDGMLGAITVMTLALYPYVYLMARVAFLETGPAAYDAARTLGAGRARAFRAVLLPLARPSVAAGLALVMMETLTDFATVQYFGVQTLSVGVYLTWKGSYDVASAVSLAVLVLFAAVAVLALERVLRGGARFHQRSGRGRGLARRELRGRSALAATAVAAAVAIAGFGFPVLRLVGWAVAGAGDERFDVLDSRFFDYLANSVTIAVIAAVVCVGISLAMTHTLRLGAGPLVRGATQLTTFGYAVPGAVVGIGVLALSQPIGGTVATGSVLGILFAHAIRFTAPAYQAVDASFQRISPHVTQSALTLGARPSRVLARIHLPMVRPGVAAALTLVLVDAIKELPLVLLLRPFGFSTLSVWVYQLASENFWEQAALPALVIVAVAAVPVAMLLRTSRPAELAAPVGAR